VRGDGDSGLPLSAPLPLLPPPLPMPLLPQAPSPPVAAEILNKEDGGKDRDRDGNTFYLASKERQPIRWIGITSKKKHIGIRTTTN